VNITTILHILIGISGCRGRAPTQDNQCTVLRAECLKLAKADIGQLTLACTTSVHLIHAKGTVKTGDFRVRD